MAWLVACVALTVALDAQAQRARLDRGVWLSGQAFALTDGAQALSVNPAGLASAEAFELHLATGLGGVPVAGDRGAGYGVLAGLPLGPLTLAAAVEHLEDAAPGVKAQTGLLEISRISAGLGSRLGGWLDVGVAWRGQFGQATTVGDVGTLDLGLQLNPWKWLAVGLRVSDLLGATTLTLPPDSGAVLGPHSGWGWALKLLDERFIWAMGFEWPGSGSLATMDGNLQYRSRDGWGGGVEWRLYGTGGTGGGDSRVGVFVRRQWRYWGLGAGLHRDDDPFGEPVVRAGLAMWLRFEPQLSPWRHLVRAVSGRKRSSGGRGLQRQLSAHRVGWTGPLSGGPARRAAAVARALMVWSKAMEDENVEGLCGALAPGEVRFDIETHGPELVVHQSFGREEACLSLAGGELKSFVHEFGPDFMHAEVASLLPALFRIHGSAYFRLSEAQDIAYVDHLARVRRGQSALRCTVYKANPMTIIRPPAGSGRSVTRVYEIELQCDGLRHYLLQFEGGGKAEYRLRKLSISF